MKKKIRTRIFSFLLIFLVIAEMSVSFFNIENVKKTNAQEFVLVDFGSTEAENIYGVDGWNTPIIDYYTRYSSAGPGGTMKVAGRNTGADYQGIIGSARNFQLGEGIKVVWYNNTSEIITFTPKITLEDTDGRDENGEIGWYDMTQTVIEPGQTATSLFILDENTIGSRSVVNVNVNYYDSNEILCDKILLDNNVDIEAPTAPAGVQSVLASQTSVSLSWLASSDNVGVAGYRIYRSGNLVGTTQDLSYTDEGLKQGVTYFYQIKAYDAIGNESEPGSTSISTEAENYILIKEEDGVTTQNYPVQIARPFLRGEILNFPKVLLDGVAVETQADIKQRYEDGSVKHAIISFLIPELVANSTVKATFLNQNDGLNDQKISKEDMLSSGFNFDAEMNLIQGNTLSISARNMLDSNDYNYWMEGPVATTVLLEDTSTELKYDTGWERKYQANLQTEASDSDTTFNVDNVEELSTGDLVNFGGYEVMKVCSIDGNGNTFQVGDSTCPNIDGRGLDGTEIHSHSNGTLVVTDEKWKTPTDDKYKSFHPSFEATFWPEVNKVKVRFTGEISNTESLQNLEYSLKLFTGDSNPQERYSKENLLHTAKTRWSKEFWIGGEPSKVSIDHNLPYLVKTRFIPNYDVGKEVSDTKVSSLYEEWQTKDKDLYDSGFYFKYQNQEEAALYPEFVVQWLFTGDWRMKEIVFKQAELAMAWPKHLREGDSSKYFDLAKTVPAFGKIVSISDRPTYSIKGDNMGEDEDKILPVGIVTTEGWFMDMAHQDDLFTAQYTLTGEHWLLEQSEFWAGHNAMQGNGAWFDYRNGRGPTGAEGHIYFDGQPRSIAWRFRTRANVAFVCPDGSAEKNYFNRLIDDAVAIWQGTYNITGTDFEGNTNWTWGHDVLNYSLFEDKAGIVGQPVLHHWRPGVVDNSYEGWLGYDVGSIWEMSYVIDAFGRAEELGFPVSELKQYFVQHHIGIVNESGYPHLIAAYKETIRKSETEYFEDWQDWANHMPLQWRSEEAIAEYENCHSPNHYEMKTLSALSYGTDAPGGQEAWDYVSGKKLGCSCLNDEPMWALVPRSQVNYHILNVSRGGNGFGRVESNPVGLNCGISCQKDFAEGSNVTLTAIPEENSTFTSWTGGACDGSNNPVCTVTMDDVKIVTANFELNTAGTHAITAIANTGGSISPSGNIIVDENDNQSFSITASNGYQIKKVLVDGISVGAVETYTFENVTTNHVIEVQFETLPKILAYKLLINTTDPNKPLSSVLIKQVNDNLEPPYNFTGYISLTEDDNSMNFEAVTGNGYEFVGWTNNEFCSGTGTCSISKTNKQISLTAYFNKIENVVPENVEVLKEESSESNEEEEILIEPILKNYVAENIEKENIEKTKIVKLPNESEDEMVEINTSDIKKIHNLSKNKSISEKLLAKDENGRLSLFIKIAIGLFMVSLIGVSFVILRKKEIIKF